MFVKRKLEPFSSNKQYSWHPCTHTRHLVIWTSLINLKKCTHVYSFSNVIPENWHFYLCTSIGNRKSEGLWDSKACGFSDQQQTEPFWTDAKSEYSLHLNYSFKLHNSVSNVIPENSFICVASISNKIFESSWDSKAYFVALAINNKNPFWTDAKSEILLHLNCLFKAS